MSVRERYSIGQDKLSPVRVLELEEELKAYVDDIVLAVALERNRKTLRTILKNLEDSGNTAIEMQSAWSKSKRWLLRASEEEIGQIVSTLKRKAPEEKLDLKFLKDRDEMNDLLKK